MRRPLHRLLRRLLRRSIIATVGALLLIALANAPGRAEPAPPWDPRPPGAFREIWPVDEAGQTALRTELGRAYRTLHTDHFSLTHAALEDTARYRGQILESLYAAFVLFFDSQGFALERPGVALPLVFFRTREELSDHLAIPDLPDEVEGLYRSDVSRAYFFDTLGRNINREANERAQTREIDLRRLEREARRADDDALFEWKLPNRPERRVTRSQVLRLIAAELRELHYDARRFRHDLGQSSIETMCHEGVHLLSHRMGVLRADRPNPRWISEGLAVFFEPSENGFLLETGAVHWRPLDALVKAHERGERIALADLLTQDELFFEWSAAQLAYYEAWSLVHFLATRHPAALMEYFRALASVDPAKRSAAASARDRLALFERSFGGPISEIEAQWRSHVASLQRPGSG